MLTLPVLMFVMLLLPLAGAGLLLALGKRLAEPLAGYVGTGVAMLTFAVSVAAMVVWIHGGNVTWGYGVGPLVEVVRWLPIGQFTGQRSTGFLDAALYVDSLTILLTSMVSLVAALVHMFSLGYMRGDRRFPQFFCYLSFFTFCMLGLLLSGTLLQLLIFWELVGGCSYLMIGFWHHRPASGAAAMKAFVVNRVGDVGFIVGLCLLIAHVGNATLPDLWLMLGNGPATGPISPVMLTLIGTLLFCGAIGKSAQFPLQTWLPDAMAGPTPVSALIHAATMVAAGVFLLARIFPILTADARLFVVIIGAITIALGSLCALAQRDIKRALAYSTIAQLGYMVLAIGVGSWVGALFHLVTHAFFKALLFLGAGNVIHAMDHDNRLERYGGLMKRLPVTGVTFALAGLAMSGAPYLSGLYSKELIIGNAAAWTQLATDQNRNALFQMALWVPVVAAYLTPLYMTRLWVLTFLGVPRDRSLFRHAGEAGTMSFPLVLLSGMTIVCGYSWFPVLPMIETAQRETQLYYTVPAEGEPISAAWPALFRTAEAAEATDAFDVVEPAAQTPAQQRVEAGLQRAHSLTGWSWLIGIVTGLLIYWRGFARTDALARFAPFRHLRYWLANGMFFDELYEFVFTGTVGLLTAAAASVDRHVIDPLINFFAAITARAGRSMARADDLAVDGVVRGVGAGVMRGGDVIRLSQPGRVRVYIACALSTVVLVLAAVLVVMRLR